jgi:copper chaperone CopZ
LERLPGVKRADVNLETGQARVVYDDTRQAPEKLAAAIDTLGFKASVISVAEPPAQPAPPRR